MWEVPTARLTRMLLSTEQAADYLNLSVKQVDEKADLLNSFTGAVTDLIEERTGPLVAVARVWTGPCVYGTADLGTSRSLPILTINRVTNLTTGGPIAHDNLVVRHGLLQPADKSALAPDGDLLQIDFEAAGQYSDRSEVPESIMQAAREALSVCWTTQSTRDLPAFALSWRGAEWIGSRKAGGFA